jgi:hypothetical protein
MAGLLGRPEALVSPGKGLLSKDHFQVSYVTNDMERACEMLERRYGISKYAHMGGDMPQGGRIDLAFAWAGGTLYEIIQARGPQTEFYNDRLPNEEFAIRMHHLGFLIHDRASWKQLEQELKEGGWPIVFESLGTGFMDAYYVEAPELGHYLEYIYPEQPGVDFFKSIPLN